MNERVRRALAWPIAIALVGGAYLVSATVPDEDALEAPFARGGALEDRLVGRTIDVRLLEAVVVDEIQLDDWRGTTAGTWVVAQLDAAAVSRRVNIVVELEIDGIVYAGTDRTDDLLTNRPLDPMLPIRGNVAIEVPTGVLASDAARDAVLRIMQRGDVRLDSVLEFRLDLSSLPSGRMLEIGAPWEVTW